VKIQPWNDEEKTDCSPLFTTCYHFAGNRSIRKFECQHICHQDVGSGPDATWMAIARCCVALARRHQMLGFWWATDEWGSVPQNVGLGPLRRRQGTPQVVVGVATRR
jgi:hypothetical protein